MEENNISIDFSCLKIEQPIGQYYIGSISSDILKDITYFDVRRILQEREIETYLGIQRPVNKKRVTELQQYVNTIDACFPTAVIIAVPGRCASYDEDSKTMTLSNFLSNDESERVLYREIAKVLDGQHRIEGLRGFEGDKFDINVSVFIDMDIAEQAYLFSTVNLAQTKVNKSLVYDLYELARSRSPQKLCHNISVALDKHEGSPLYKRIKRLGRATDGRYGETITQAAFVQSLMPYMSSNALQDRDIYKRGDVPEKVNANDLDKLIFRNMMIEKMDIEITDILWNYFDAVRLRWPDAWSASGKGAMLNKTNGFKALMRFFQDAYLHISIPGKVPSTDEFLEIFQRIDIQDDDFSTENYKPGAGGESALYQALKYRSGIEE